MPKAWRIVKEKYADTAFSGEGAARAGGRWNSRGVWVVYTSSTQSLAALETLVHLNPAQHFRYVTFSLEIDPGLIERVSIEDLPMDWRDEPPSCTTQRFGDRWVVAGRSAVLELPSILIPTESNYLLNPLHSDFRKIRIGPPEPFSFDSRLTRTL